jgi:phosphate transport system substrate-binding protein
VQPAEVAQARGAGVILLAQAVAKDGVAVIVNPANPVRGITLRMLSDIYVGKVRDWGQAGAPGLGAIQLVSRDSASGTYEFFRDAVVTLKGADKSRDYAPEALKQTSNQAVLALVGQTRSAIGYVGLGYLNDSVRAVGIIPEAGGEAVMPTAVTVLDGSYPLARDLYCVTNGEPAGPVRTYLEWIMGPKGQQIVKEAGFVSLIQP